ncbi:MAG TPA: KUP/HAK/KT family potassium transporter [Candidatus Binatia bacterium]|nr:KUP/HAK/KT family potassium transporter [Candidatus Binatia bacterium]
MTTRRESTALLTLTAIGVVFGDIGTSPLYALRQAFSGTHGLDVTPDNVLGVCSLVIWSLVLVVSIKYVSFVMRASARGEGGILALVALVRGKTGQRHAILVGLGLFGAALLVGDGMITPAISVLSAVEGLGIATRTFASWIVWITVAILVALFAVQRRGTGGVGLMFGPVMVLWFVVIAVLAVPAIHARPTVLWSIDPTHAVRFLVAHRLGSLYALGAVVLALTGAEALYADLGHFGAAPIRITWFALVFPALVINYLGQGATLLARPEASDNPFYALAPPWGFYPLVALATAATIIASQAVISGVFSLTYQAGQMGYAPRVRVRHTSTERRGEVYVPVANWVLMVATVAIVVGFRSSDRLAGAYGMAVSGTMLVTTLLSYIVARERWRWGALRAELVAGAFLLIDASFVAANTLKIAEGAWLPLAVALLLLLGIAREAAWRPGRRHPSPATRR